MQQSEASSDAKAAPTIEATDHPSEGGEGTICGAVLTSSSDPKDSYFSNY